MGWHDWKVALIFNIRFIAALRGHVSAVYQLAWSSDSRMLVTASKDTTLKLWCIRTKKLRMDLPGHQDEVFCVDWSPGGDRVASGSKDRTLKMFALICLPLGGAINNRAFHLNVSIFIDLHCLV